MAKTKEELEKELETLRRRNQILMNENAALRSKLSLARSVTRSMEEYFDTDYDDDLPF